MTMFEQWADQSLDKIDQHLARLERSWAQERKIEAIKLELDALRQELEDAGFADLDEELAGLADLPSLSGGGLQKSFGDGGDFGVYVPGQGEHQKRFGSFAEADAVGKRLTRGGTYHVLGPGRLHAGRGVGSIDRFVRSMSAADRKGLDLMCDARCRV